MDTRRAQLLETQKFVQKVDQDLTMILQSLQWDRKQLLEEPFHVVCKYDKGHRIRPEGEMSHEQDCYLKCQGYTEDDQLLPDPPDTNALVKLSTNDIKQIINEASKSDPLFKKVTPNAVVIELTILLQGVGSSGPEPLSLARLQQTYSPDERRAIHDAVVRRMPAYPDVDLAGLALPSTISDSQTSKRKSHVEVLAALRDMKRRRARYRGNASTRNYSDVLRDVVQTQMEMYTEAIAPVKPNQSTEREIVSKVHDTNNHKSATKNKEDIQLKSKNSFKGRSDWREEKGKTFERPMDKHNRHKEKYRDTSSDSRSRDNYKYNDTKGDRYTDYHKDRQRYDINMRDKHRNSYGANGSSRDKRDEKYNDREYKEDSYRRHRESSNTRNEANSYPEKSRKHKHRHE